MRCVLLPLRAFRPWVLNQPGRILTAYAIYTPSDGSSQQGVNPTTEKPTKLYPEYSEAWNLLGQVRLQLKDESGAKEAFELAAASDPTYLGPLIAMMELESQRSDWDQMSQWSTKILELHPYHMQARYYHGVANLNLRHMEQAEAALSTVRASHKADDYPYAGYLLGLMLADKGDFDAAATELKHFLKLVPLAPERARVTGFLSDWEKKGLIQGPEKN